jgi:uncharacterized iron-regulated protein
MHSFQFWRPKVILPLVLLVGIPTLASGCDRSSSPSSTSSPASSPVSEAGSTSAKVDDQQVVSDFASQVVIPTNQLFAKRAKELSSTVNTFVKNPDDQTLKAAQDAWVAARSPWEQSECFTFGPAESLGYDGALDTWPVNETDLSGILKSQDQPTSEYVGKLKDTEKGFHAIEYLLFGENNSKKAADFDQRELEYLQALSTNFSEVAGELVTSWTQGVEGQPAYQEVIATAGKSGNSTYPTVQAGAEEIVQGMIDSLDEVANEKIGKPFEEKNSQLFESRFSHNTLNDIKSNVKGAENVYLGRFPDANTSGAGLSAYVAQAKPDVDAKIKSQIQASLAALDQIPAPIEESFDDPKAASAIESAQKTINTLRMTIEQEVMPLVKG